MENGRRFLFVGEYNDDYTGGSVVFIATEKQAKRFKRNGLKVITDPFENQIYQVRKFPGSEKGCGTSSGITPEHFWSLIEKGEFTEDFKADVREILSNESQYPGFSNKKIRVDWLWEADSGIYLIYQQEVFDNDGDEVFIVSDTYYCA